MAGSSRLVILAPKALLPGSDLPQAATIEVDTSTGKILEVHHGLKPELAADEEVLKVDEGRILLPGLIDTHVHLNQPGRTAWEGFQTGTTAAISGGVTTLIDMPLNSIPPTTTVENLDVKRNEAKEVGTNCDVGFWGGIIPGNEGDLSALLDEGVKGFKCFLIESGVDEFPCVAEEDLVKACDALTKARKGKGTEPDGLVLFHAELEKHQHANGNGNGNSNGNDNDKKHEDPKDYSTFLNSRPAQLELDALELILKMCKSYPNIRFHIVHLSAAEAVPRIKSAREQGISNLTVETCYHYLTLSSEDIPANATQYKCCPPIRSEANRKQICQALLDGVIDYVVSDHSPCIPELKKGDFMSAWGGVSGLGLGLSLLWTEFGRKADVGRIMSWVSTIQAQQVGLQGQKGSIAKGMDADLVIFDPDAEYVVDQEHLLFKNKVSPYVGKTLKGVVEKTYLRGQLVWDGKKVTQCIGQTL